jgi:SSS family transporter
MLSHLDLAIVAVYILAMTLFGVWFSKKQKDLRTYFVGDRNVGWFMVLVSIVATETSAVTFLSVPGTAFNPQVGNMTFLQLSFGYIIGRCLVAWLFLPLYMKGELFSAYQVLRERFGPGVQRLASALFLITRTIADGLRLFLTALVMQYVGWSIPEAIVATGLITIVYTYLGGMKAVLWTDLIQFAIKIAGAALAIVCVIDILPDGWTTLVNVGEAAGKFQLFDTRLDLTIDNGIWAGVIGGAVFSMASHGADQLMVQRYLCAKSLGQARLALVLSGFTILAQFTLFLLVGIGLYAAMETGVFDVTGLMIEGKLRPSAKDEVFGHFIVTKMQPGIVGILVAAILAAAMSTLSSSLNSSANALVTDFYKPLRPGLPEKRYVLISRILTAFWGIMQIGVALIAYESGSSRSIVVRVLSVAGMTTGLILGLFILGRFKHPVSSKAAIIGLASGFCAVLGVWLPEQLPKGIAWLPEQVPTGVRILAWPWFAPVGAGTTVAVALLVNTLSKPHGSTATPRDGSP